MSSDHETRWIAYKKQYYGELSQKRDQVAIFGLRFFLIICLEKAVVSLATCVAVPF